MSIFSNRSHLERRVGLSDTILKGNHPGTIPVRFGLIWFSGFRGKDLNVIFYQNMPNLHNRYKSAERKISQKKPEYSWLSLSRIRLTRISGWVEFLSKSRTSLCINIYNFTPVESNSDESKFRLSRIKVLVPRCRKPYYLHSLSQIYLSKHVYYLRIKIGSQVKHPVIEFDIFTLGYFTCLFHNLSN